MNDDEMMVEIIRKLKAIKNIITSKQLLAWARRVHT